jgi:putative transposase
VRVKVNPLDLLFIHVWDDQEKLWIPAKARQEGYAKGLDLHCHTLFRRHSDRLSGRDDLEGWLEAYAHLQHLIRSALPDALSIALQSKMARAMGIGTPYLFRNLQADGRLIAPPGAAPDLALNPLWTATGSAAGRAQPIITSPATPSAAQKQRPIPQFKSDLTLGQRR